MTPFNTFGYRWSFNPGPFTIKEHVCITVMANVVVAGAYATDVVLAQRIFYGQQVSWAYQILIVLSSQIIGFSLGGILRQFVVWPSSMIWPGALVNSALFNTLHKHYGKRDRGHMTRERFFTIVLACTFVWYWFPGFIFTALSVFNWACWIAPNNVVVNSLFGTNSGLGMGILTFDWSLISYIGSPLVTPWWSEANTAVSFVVIFWIIAPIIYFTNTWDTAFLPISSNLSFDNTGSPYQPKQIITDGLFDQAKYIAYSPLLIPTTMLLAYGVAFAAFIAVFVHIFLWFRHDLVRRFRSSLKDERDVHSRLMLEYKEVPFWWYGSVGIICLSFLLVAVSVFLPQLPAWAVLLAFIFSAILSLPLAMLQAITNQQVPTQVMHELVAGYMLPGRPIANMLFKAIAHIGTTQAVTFCGNLKLGHYMKIPPRIMFATQLVAAFISAFVVIGVQDWMLGNVEDVCTPHQKNGFCCPSSNTFATASLIWGGIGPRRLFSPGAPYAPLLWFFLNGGLAPIPFYLLARRFPLSFWRYINIPVCFAGLGLGTGVAISMIVVFFSVIYPKGGIQFNWWGNVVWTTTADAKGVPLYTLHPEDTIGPKVWS
ncbi:putative OPT oligopeptide transporter protein [Lyophyllum shimeji]|uniref:OPT oligopeptide transporter protein n=1 Tax=Lyophyllum shimeji TaxID=47721 RepID=A0A9P3UPT7_LYOSH|nr:putative OPT oligopeptide transporter protein [Lyophyllum shimeji]